MEENIEQNQEIQQDEKDLKIFELEKIINNNEKSYIVEKEIIKSDAKNITATKSLLKLNYDDNVETFEKSVKEQIEKMKNDDSFSFLFNKVDNNFKGIEIKQNYDEKKENKTLKECVKSYFSK